MMKQSTSSKKKTTYSCGPHQYQMLTNMMPSCAISATVGCQWFIGLRHPELYAAKTEESTEL